MNPDAIRLAMHGQRDAAEAEPFVWAVAKTMTRALFIAGHGTVIIDATNTSVKRRAEWISSKWTTRFKHIDTSKEVCLKRAESENDVDIVPVIERMADAFEPFLPEEEDRKLE